MRSPLERRIAALRSQARLQLALHGVAWVLAGAILAITLACLFDWLFHLTRELRVALLLGLGVLTGWLLWRHVISPLIVRFRDLDIALKVEDRWPGLQDRLATTVQFLQLRDAGDTEDLRGSLSLREETIRRTLGEVEKIDFREVIDRRPARRALLTAAVPLGLGVLLSVAAPDSTRLALARLFNPLSAAEWPKQTHLAIIEPDSDAIRLARGDSFKLEVGVGAGELLPASGEVTYRYENGDVVTRRLGVRDADSRLTDRLAEVERSFTYSVRAGDDVTAPRRVDVVPPPALTHVRALITPPDYTGERQSIIEPLAGATVAGSEFDIDGVLEGSLIEIQALSNKAVAQATLLSLGSAPWEPTPENASPSSPAVTGSETAPSIEPPPVEIKPGGSQLVARFKLEGTGAFAFELVDADGFRSQTRERIRFNLSAISDAVPAVTFEDPTNNRDVTPDATVPLAIRAEDDFGIGRIMLEYRIGNAGSESVARAPLVLWTPDEPANESGAAVKFPRNQLVTHAWDLKSLGPEVQPGAVITIQAMATDLDNLRGPKLGKSRELQLRILDHNAVAQQLDEARRAIRDEIARTLDMERQAMRPVEEARRTLERTRQLGDENRESVRNAETIQRQVTSRVADPADGLERRIERYLEDQQNLRIDNAEAKAQMQDLLERTRAIRQGHLEQAEESLSRANAELDDAGDERQSPKNADAPSARDPSKAAPQSRAAESAANKKPSGSETARQQTAGASRGENENQPQAAAGARDPAKAEDGNQARGDNAKTKANEDTSAPASKSTGSDQADPQSPATRGQEPSASQPQGGNPQQGGDRQQGETTRQPSRSGSANQEQGPAQSGERDDNNQNTEPQGQRPNPQEPNNPAAGGAEQQLARAETEQRAIADELQRMLDNLGEFETYRGMVDEAKNLLNEQRETIKQTEDLSDRDRAAGRDPQNLTEAQKAERENLGARQERVGEDLRQLERKMDELAQRTDPQDPLSASALREASNQSRQRNTSEKAADAGKQLSQNQVGKAREQQREVETDLKKLLDSLQNRRENELARLVKELKNAEREMENLRRQQAENRLRTQQAGQIADEQQRREELQRLAKEQQQLEQELRRQIQRLQKLRADRAARSSSRAAQRMSRASQQQEQGDQDDADEAGKEQDEALADLEEAQEEIEEARREAEEQLAMEQLSRVRDDLVNLSKRQSDLADETETYSKKQAEDALTLAQKKSVVGLGRAQDTLRDETSDLIDRLDAAPVFALIVKRASEAMAKASETLRRGDASPEALAAQRLAARRFQQLLDALKPDEDGMAGGQQQQQGGGQGGGGGGAGSGDGIPSIAQLKLLKILQEELNERTDALDEIRERKKSLTTEQEAELAGLHDEQKNVADLARDLTQPRRSDGEE